MSHACLLFRVERGEEARKHATHPLDAATKPRSCLTSQICSALQGHSVRPRQTWRAMSSPEIRFLELWMAERLI